MTYKLDRPPVAESTAAPRTNTPTRHDSLSSSASEACDKERVVRGKEGEGDWPEGGGDAGQALADHPSGWKYDHFLKVWWKKAILGQSSKQ